MAKIDLLKPKVKRFAEKLCDECKKVGYNITLTHTLRTVAEQNELYAQGRTKPGEIVTNAKGGFSFHNYGVAFDICPVVNNKLDWNNTLLFEAVGKIGISLGLEWGGSWKELVDRQHFQYTAGYSLADFRNNKIDWKKFEINNESVVNVSPQNNTPVLKVSTREGLNVRTGPSAEQNKIGKLVFGKQITPIEKINGWVKIKYKDSFGWVSGNYLS